MWLDLGGKGEFDVDIGAVVEFSDQGQIKLVDDEGDVSCKPRVVSVYHIMMCKNVQIFDPK